MKQYPEIGHFCMYLIVIYRILKNNVNVTKNTKMSKRNKIMQN